MQCSSLERLVSPKSGKVVHQIYRKGSYLRILQSRHIRHSDRQGKNKEFYSDKLMITCPSCGADVGRILRTFKIKKNVEVTDNGKIII